MPDGDLGDLRQPAEVRRVFGGASAMTQSVPRAPRKPYSEGQSLAGDCPHRGTVPSWRALDLGFFTISSIQTRPATPGPFLGAVTQPGAHGVVNDVVAGGDEVFVCINDIRAKALFEDVTLPRVAAIESLRIHAVQPLHPHRESALACLDQQVIVRRHETVRVACPSKRQHVSSEQGHECAAIHLVLKERQTAIRTCRDVEDAVAQEAAWTPAHLTKG